MMVQKNNFVSTVFIFIAAVTVCCHASFTQNYYGLHDVEEEIPQGASTLAFVFDITGSMYDDLVQVIEGAARILSTILARREKSIYNYVLVPFHDPDVGPVTVTTDPDLFQRQLKELYVQGGGDCPEMSIGAIKLALEVCLPNSHIYVFTDARAKDYYLLEDVLKLIQRKQSQVVFVMTGDCGNHSHPGYQAYERIASTSSGQVFHLRKSDVDEVLNFVRVSLQARKVNLFAVDRHAADLKQFEFDIDGSLREFTISVSGENPVITIINSRGEVIDERHGLNELLSHKNISIVNIKDPPPGKWKLRVDTEGAHTIRATGLSKTDFVHGFSREPTANLKETYHRPLKGAPTYLLLNATDLPEPATFQSVKIVDLEGNDLQNIPLHRFPGSNLFNASRFYPPNKYFYLKVAGSDQYGYPIERITSTAISAQLPDAPEVSTRPRMNGYYEEDTDLRCYIQSLVPFSITWFKEGVQISQEQHFLQTTENVLTVPEVTMMAEGYYSCNASNIAGSSSSVIYLDVKEPPPVISHAGNVSGSLGNLAVLPCEVESVFSHNISWNRLIVNKHDSTVKAAPIPDVARIIFHANSSLVIKRIASEDEGWYRCTAANEGGVVHENIYLHSYSSPVVFVMPQTTKFKAGDLINITCISHGYPEPTVRWVWNPKHNQNFYSGHTKIIGKNLIINSAIPEDEGKYNCIATNAAGSEITSAFLHYIELPLISLPEREILVKNGDQATLRCIAEGIPDPKVTWYKSNIEIHPLSYIHISNDGSLIIYDVQDSDASNYTCVATNEAGSSNETMALKVGSKPSLIKLPKVVSLEILQNGSIPCVATGIPSPLISWHFKNGSAISLNPKISVGSTGSLIIKEADPSVETIFVCQAENKFGAEQQEVKVHVTGIKKPLLSPLPPSLDVPKGENRIVPCVLLDGNPKPHITWLRNGRHIQPGYNIEIDDDANLIISDANQFHEANFTCEASNIGGNASTTVMLNILFQPEISASAQEFSTIQGSSISLPCNVVGDPKPVIVWRRNGIELNRNKNYGMKNDGSLKIKVVTEEEGGQYLCLATNIVGTTEKTLKLSVKVPPKISKDVAVYNVTEGDVATLNCKSYAKPAAVIEWRKKSEALKLILDQYVLLNGSLQFTARLKDAGSYICEASNDVGSSKQEVNLNVNVPPQANIQGEQTITVTRGNQLSLLCDTSGIPSPVVQWEKNGSTLLSTHVESNKFALHINDVNIAHEGEYWCSAKNLVGSAADKVYIQIHDPPYFPFSNEMVSATVGDEVNLKCNASGYPKPLFTWEIPTKNSLIHYFDNGTLHIPFVQESDIGIYTCTAKNSAGHDSMKFNFSVYSPPVMTKKSTPTTDYVEGSTVILDCSTSAHPPPEIKWYKNNNSTPLQTNKNINLMENGQKLLLSYANISDTGQYFCVATNIAGKTSDKFSVNILVSPKFMKSSPRDFQALPDEQIVLDCLASGEPKPIYIWKKNQQVISKSSALGLQFNIDGHQLKIEYSRESDAGTYTCIALNKVGSISQNFEVSVLVPPQIQEHFKEEVMFHQVTQLQCIVSGVPEPTITWLKNGKELSKQSTDTYFEDNKQKLIFLKPEQNDSGDYTCQATNSVGEAKKDVRLNILVPPHIENQSLTETTQVQEGKELVLNCLVSGNPSPRIVWMKNNRLMSLQNSTFVAFSENYNKLKFANATIYDAGRYTCIASNRAGSTEKDFSVSVLSPPKFEKLQKYDKHSSVNDKKQVLESRPIVLHCQFSGNPPPQIRWLKDGLSLNLSSNILLFNQGKQLHIKNAKVEHSGKYACVAQNEAGKSQREFDVDVLVPSSIEKHEIISEFEVIEGHSLTLTCNATGNPSPSVIWIKDDSELEESEHEISPGYLKILNAKSEDSGKYVCVASNVAGTSEKEFIVNVLVSPHLYAELVEAKGRRSVQVNKPISLSCPITGNPPPQMQWLKDGSFIDFSSTRNIHTYGDGEDISILRARGDDTGLYTCIADNGVGNTSYDFEVEVFVPPSIHREKVKSNYFVRENDSVTIKCLVNGHPKPIITWLKDGELLIPFSSDLISFSEDFQLMHLKFTSQKDAGKYSCIAGNEVGTDEKEFKLDVLVPPKVENKDVDKNFTSVLNKAVTIRCPVSGIPPPVITWYKNGKILNRRTNPSIMFSPDSKHLKIYHIKASDAATYKCKAVNDIGTTEKEFVLNVHVPPKILETDTNNIDDYYSEDVDDSQSVKKATENGTTHFECFVDGNPMPIVLWLKDGHVININNIKYLQLLDGQMLKVMDVKVSDSGLYTCVVSNVVGTKEKNFELDVLVPPHIKKSDSPQTLSNRPAMIECLAESNPPPVITWQRNNIPIDFTSNKLLKVTEDGRKLHFLKTSTLDQGQYTCIAENEVGKTEATYNLDVHVAPTIEESFLKPEFIENEKVIINCNYSGNPPPSISWLINGEVLSETILKDMNIKKLNESTLEIHEAKSYHSGHYKCIVSNSVAVSEKSYDLYVKAPPRIVNTSEPNMAVLIHQPVNMYCLAEAEPQAVITWSKEEILLNQVQDPFIHILDEGQKLQILRTRETDDGHYSCEAANGVGNDSRSFILNILIPPQVKNIVQEDSRPKATKAIKGDNAELQCYVYGNPQPIVSWLKEGKVLHSDNAKKVEMLENNQLLRIVNVEIEDGGQYTCIASSPLGTEERHFDFSVQVPPKISTELKTEYVARLNKVLILHCEADGNPKPMITWMKNGQLIDEYFDPNLQLLKKESALLIRFARTDDSGRYSCVASSSVGQDERHFNIEVHTPASVDHSTLVNSVLAISNQAATLHCPASGIPAPTISWLKDGEPTSSETTSDRYQILEDGKTLRINSAAEVDVGNYSCVVFNDVGTDEAKFVLDVLFPPKMKSMKEALLSKVLEGDNTVLQCPLENSKHMSTIAWTKDQDYFTQIHKPPHFEFSTDYKMVKIMRAQSEDSGTYKCIASNAGGDSIHEMNLLVLAPAKIIYPAESITSTYVKEHHSIGLECAATGHPEPKLEWRKDYEFLSKLSNIITPTLGKIKIINATLNEAGIYTCYAFNEGGTDEKSYNLTVYTPPTIDVTLHGVPEVAFLNEEIYLECPTEGNPLPKVMWYKDSQLLMEGQRLSFSEDGMSFKISHATTGDAGKYVCMAVNEAGTSEAELFVKVYVPPDIEDIEIQGLQNPVVNQSVRIQCDAQGLPTPVITWFKDNILLVPDEKKYSLSGAGRFLDVLNAQSFDSGAYICQAENVAGQTKKEVLLSVSVPPGLESGLQKDHQVTVGKPMRLECDVSGIPPPSIHWFKNHMPLTAKDRVHLINNNYALLFSYTLESDAALYMCVATNNVGSVEQKFNVTILVPPSFPNSKSEDKSAILGSTVQMDCLSSGFPEPDIVWSYNNISLSSDENIDIQNSSITIYDVDLAQAGIYSCEASNVAGKMTKAYKLSIIVPPAIKDSNDSTFISAIRNNPVRIECPASGIPMPSIMWLKDNVPLLPELSLNSYTKTQGTELIINNSKPSDSGSYTCMAINSAGNATRKFTLSILEPPSIKSIFRKTKALLGSEASFDCVAQGVPELDIFWLKDGAPVSTLVKRTYILENSSLLLGSLKSEDSGNYTCIASNEVGSASKSLHFEVISPPTIITKETTQKVLAGKSISLNCKVYGHPIPTIIWHKNSLIIHSDDKHNIFSNGTILIKNATEADGGIYKCFAENEAGSIEATHKLNFLLPSKISGDFIKEHYVTQTNPVVLQCSSKGSPVPIMAWERNGVSLDLSNPRYKVFPSGDLHISLTQSSDTGIYSCIAKNEAGSDKQDTNLVVFVPPSISLDRPKSIVAIKGSAVEVLCSSKGFPPPKINWHKTGSYIIETNFNENLFIQNIQPDQGGNYVCVAINKAGRDHQTINIQVHVPPVFKVLPKSQDVSIGSTVTLNCETDGYPLPTITWLQNNTQVNGRTYSTIGSSKLIIENIEKEDQGTYICLAQNAAGERKAAATVYVRAPPIILYSSNVKKVQLEEVVLLECVVKGDPSPNIIWLKDGLRVETNQRVKQVQNGSLLIYNSSSQDSGQYKCIASNNFGSAETVAELIIRSKPEFTIEPYNTKTQLGDSIYMHCKVIGEPKPTVKWEKDNILIQNDESFFIFPNNTLKILTAQIADEATYSCTASNAMGSAVAEAALLVQVHGKWSQWQEWGPCSVSCGEGFRYRQRFCNDPSPRNGGKSCIGVSSEAQHCNDVFCPVDGEWGNWMKWGECSTTCGVGSRVRRRKCDNPIPSSDGLNCTGNNTQIEFCTSIKCPIDGKWSTWSSWEPCSVSCGKGVQVRRRECNDPEPSHGGHHCYGDSEETKACNVADCEVHGEWGSWTEWSFCSSSCGGGTRQRTRKCDSPEPSYGGKFCSGTNIQIDYCNNVQCPVNGGWGHWSSWGECSASCNKGQQKRFRSCNNPSPDGGGRDCSGPSQEMQSCNAHLCPIDGKWSPWSEWTSCSVTCGVGFHSRTRTCNNPSSSNGGKECSGDKLELEECGDDDCDVAPVQSHGHLVGIINGVDIGPSKMRANISELGLKQIVMATIGNITEDTADWMKILAPLLDPLYWTTAYEIGDAVNGYTLTKGFFRRETQVHFISGESLQITYVGKGADKRGNLLLDIAISGEIPDLPAVSEITAHPYSEDYVQTGAGSLFAFSTRSYQIGDHILPYSWNHTIFYDELEQKMPYLIERLYAKGIDNSYDPVKQEITYTVSATIERGLKDECFDGFSEDANGLYCVDVNECELQDPCSQVCVNFPGGFSCLCLNGFTLDTDGKTCNDIDECQLGIDFCTSSEECTNTIGSYKCLVICPNGYERVDDESYCQDVDECATNMHKCSQLCINAIGSYYCSCNRGYYLSEDSNCIDVNECSQAESPCSHTCTNTLGGFACSCPYGYEFLDNVCRDIDECKLGIALCSEDQDCKNLPGDYECHDICTIGFSRAENGSCVDDDECYDETSKCHDTQICINTNGSYRCSCHTGFYSNGPGNPCKDIDECKSHNICQHKCENTIGSYQCICPTGYSLVPAGKACQDIDECSESKISCGPNRLCFNTRGSFHCIDTPCPKNYDRDSLTGYCKLECGKNGDICPPNIKYSEILAFKTVALPSGILAYQDLVRLIAYDQDGVQLPNTAFSIIENETGIPFRIRLESGKGVLYAQKNMESNKEHQIKVQAISYDTNSHVIQYMTKFLVFISVSKYPY